ncbi:Putative lipoprotein mlpA precursor [Archangium gephyra]|uniref:Lipoprotein mlpA n=1 Tax=Archangium gephyra TaxID=48 RepID=A0AAC8THU6_9BACT|nr:Putative lipoprotein mlpA precursor [Archangium gephyra]
MATYKPVETNTCPELPGELLGLQKYAQPSGEQLLALKPRTLNAMDPTDALDPEHPPYALGVLPAEADAEGFCTIPLLSIAEKQVASVPEPSLPTHALYRWSNVRLVALPEAPGTQLLADLEYTADGCTARYEVWAMWPGNIGCADEDSPREPDDSLCQQSRSIPRGFAVTCDPSLLRCVPAQRPPSLRSAPAP